MTQVPAGITVKSNKYHAVKTEYDGVLYDSKKEAAYAQHLQYLKHAHELKDRVTIIERQFPMNVYIKSKHVFSYILDFKVSYGDGHIEYIDVKGSKIGSAYAMFRLKKKCVEAQYDVEIKEV